MAIGGGKGGGRKGGRGCQGEMTEQQDENGPVCVSVCVGAERETHSGGLPSLQVPSLQFSSWPTGFCL